jgi:hypothetical protein
MDLGISAIHLPNNYDLVAIALSVALYSNGLLRTFYLIGHFGSYVMQLY